MHMIDLLATVVFPDRTALEHATDQMVRCCAESAPIDARGAVMSPPNDMPSADPALPDFQSLPRSLVYGHAYALEAPLSAASETT